jgi:hypothetical protein
VDREGERKKETVKETQKRGTGGEKEAENVYFFSDNIKHCKS